MNKRDYIWRSSWGPYPDDRDYWRYLRNSVIIFVVAVVVISCLL